MRLDDFYERLWKNKATVIGIGVSNTPLIKYLKQHGAEVTARDIKTRENFGSLADELERDGVKLRLGEDYLEGLDEEFIFRSPGIRPDIPEFEAARARGAVVTSEIEMFLELCPCKVFAVTGSDGKTTTTTLTGMLLKTESEKRARGGTFKVLVGGNIGRPLLPEIDNLSADDYVVAELSSFQLQSLTEVSPYGAAVTNVTPNHLNWHKDMDEYTRAKENIFLNPGCGRLVLNYGCDTTREMAQLVDLPVSWFSAKTMPEQRRSDDVLYYLENGFIMRRAGETVKEVLDISKIKVPGIHNVENFMTAIALTWGFVSNRTIYDVARKFKGVEHRCELVRLVNGVKYYNSSIDSSPTRTEACLRSFKEKVIVICGGYDKHIPYEPLAKPLIDCAKVVVLVGATSPKIKEALLADPDYAGSPEIIEIDGLDDAAFVRAVRTAGERAEPGDSVVLSPASASFDVFKNFMVRGNRFKEIVRSLDAE